MARKTLRWLLALALFIGTLGTASTGAATAAEPDIKQRLLSIPGMSLIEEKP